MGKSSKPADRPSGGHRGDAREAEARRASPRDDHRRGLRAGRGRHRRPRPRSSRSSTRPHGEVQRQAARRHRRARLGLPDGDHQDGRRQPAARRRRHAGRLPRRPAGVRPALDIDPGADGAQVLHRGRPARARDPRPQPRARLHDPLVRRHHRRSDSTKTAQIKAIADKFAGTADLRDKFIAVPWTGEGRRRRSPTASTSRSPTGRSAASRTPRRPAKQVGVWQYCSDVCGAALKTFMNEYPYIDSPEPERGRSPVRSGRRDRSPRSRPRRA